MLDPNNHYIRLYHNAKRLAWDPARLDLSQDAESWQRIVREHPEERYAEQLLLYLSLFDAGEVAVTQTLSPFLGAIARAGLGLEREIFLTTQLLEEAKHTEFFRRYHAEVLGEGVALPPLPGDAHRVLVSELDAIADALRREDDPTTLRALLVQGVTHYMGVVEGTLGRTAYQVAHTALGQRGWLPGLRHALRLIRRDEGRHIGFGIQFVRDLVAMDRAYRPIVERTFRRFLPLVEQTVRAFDFPHRLVDENPLPAVARDAYWQFAALRHQRSRAAVPERALALQAPVLQAPVLTSVP